MTPRQRRRAVLASNFGRAAGWDVLRDGQVVASLTEVVAADMFWHGYRLTPWLPELLEPSSETKLRSKLTGEIVDGWWTAPHADAAERRVWVRGLFLPLG